MNEQKHYAWTDGMPTGPDVTMLQKMWSDLKVGDRIPYEDVETLLGLKRDSTRWKTVTNAWREREEEKGRVIKCDPGVAFFVATTDQILGDTHPTLLSMGRLARKQRKRVATVQPSNEQEKLVRDHHGRLLSVIEREAKKHRMNLLPTFEQKAPVQIGPPKEKSAV